MKAKVAGPVSQPRCHRSLIHRAAEIIDSPFYFEPCRLTLRVNIRFELCIVNCTSLLFWLLPRSRLCVFNGKPLIHLSI